MELLIQDYTSGIRTYSPLRILAHWIKEREAIRQKKEAGRERPWTNDPILRRYRFCNVHREDDRVTRWLKHNWRDPHANDPKLWHAMIVARYINWPPTLHAIGYPEPWTQRARGIVQAIRKLQEQHQKIFTGAYIVSTNGAHIDKVSYVMTLFERAWHAQSPIASTLAETHKRLLQINGIGSFMAAQIIADLKHTPWLFKAEDWGDWAAPGPGSLRGLSRVRGLGTGSTWRVSAFVPELLKLREELKPLIDERIYARLCLQDLQNCLCEYDKYCRVLYGQGRPRSTYTQSDEPMPAASSYRIVAAEM